MIGNGVTMGRSYQSVSSIDSRYALSIISGTRARPRSNVKINCPRDARSITREKRDLHLLSSRLRLFFINARRSLSFQPLCQDATPPFFRRDEHRGAHGRRGSEIALAERVKIGAVKRVRKRRSSNAHRAPRAAGTFRRQRSARVTAGTSFG